MAVKFANDYKENTEVAKLLIEKGANLDFVNKVCGSGQTNPPHVLHIMMYIPLVYFNTSALTSVAIV